MIGQKKGSPKNRNRFQFLKEISLKTICDNKKKYNLKFSHKIPLKLNRIKKKVHQKIEIAFNFTNEIPLKINRTKKKGSQKN